MEKTARERREEEEEREKERKIPRWFSRIWKSRTHDCRRLRKLDFSPCPRCYTPFRHPCETISLSKFNANTVQIRQPHCWGPIKGHKAAQLLLIREGRQTGLTRCPFFALSVISSFQARERGRGRRGGRRERSIDSNIMSVHSHGISRAGARWRRLRRSKSAFHTRFACAYRLSPDDTPDGSSGDRHLSPCLSVVLFFFFPHQRNFWSFEVRRRTCKLHDWLV